MLAPAWPTTENSTSAAPSSGLIAPAAAAAESEMRLKKKASVKLRDNKSPKLTNSGHVTCHRPGSGISTGGTEGEASGVLPGGSERAFTMRPGPKLTHASERPAARQLQRGTTTFSAPAYCDFVTGLGLGARSIFSNFRVMRSLSPIAT